ncbi:MULTISPECIES: phage holin family protein [Aerococcaceae]|uniref:phage holin family protein n=1 Tax=Hutsoniella sourekii TaxID=87650 RepID=UPI0004B2453B|nr:phage holin family protein [Hutsoniella sourekii]
MLKHHDVTKLLGILGGFVGWFFGPLDGLLTLLLVMVIIDYITGVLRAIYEMKLSSKVGRHGITKKVMIFLIVGVANILDLYVFGLEHTVLRTAAICFYASNEGLSIIENAAGMGMKVPQKIKDTLQQLNDKEDRK